jgi:predicted peptidase
VTYNYKVWVPANYNSVSKVPVLLALHGSGGKGNDNVSQTTQGVGVVIRSNPNFPALVVFPQGPAGEGPTRSTFVRISQTALAQTLNEYGKRDLTRVYITGLSYGAIQSWEIAYKNPNLFAGSLEISGNLCAICMFGTSSTDAQATATVAPVIKTLPVWLFQGDQDTQVPVTSTRILVAALKAVGSPIIYTEIAGGDHALWDGVYARADVWTWLWAQHR